MTRIPTTLLLLCILAIPARAAEPAVPSAIREEIDRVTADAAKIASRIRGLEFLTDVPVTPVSREEYRTRLIADVERMFGKGDDLVNLEVALRRLGVLRGDQGVRSLMDEYFPATVAGNYDAFRKRISLLRWTKDSRWRTSLLVHELTHALQDQHYNLSHCFETGEKTFDRLLALGALVEGDAESVQRTHEFGVVFALAPLSTIRSRGQAEIKRYLDRMKEFPRGIARTFIFQYLDGLLFVETLRRRGGGYRAIDRAYRDLPGSTEQILHPSRYLTRDHPTRILLPDDERILFQNVLGELGVRVVLEEYLDAPRAAAAADGWDGDRLALLARDGTEPALAWLSTWDSEKEAREFEAAARAMLELRQPKAPLTGPAGRSIRVQRDGESVHLVERRGSDVLFALGLPATGFAETLSPVWRAEKRTLVEKQSSFGRSVRDEK